MGQQQILIIILVTVIVAVATIIAIDTMQESQENVNRDALQQDMLLIINDAQTYYYRSSVLQGGGRSFSGIEISDISINDSTVNGTYSITGDGNELMVQGNSNSNDTYLRADAEMSDGSMQIEWEEE